MEGRSGSVWLLRAWCWHPLSPDLSLMAKGPKPWLTWMSFCPQRKEDTHSHNPPQLPLLSPPLSLKHTYITLPRWHTWLCAVHLTTEWMSHTAEHVGPIICHGQRSPANVTMCVSRRRGRSVSCWIVWGAEGLIWRQLNFQRTMKGNKHVIRLQITPWNKTQQHHHFIRLNRVVEFLHFQ